MSLRDIKITVPTFTAQVPSTKKKVKFRAFNVGDEKALLMASESKDAKHMVQTIKDVLTSCVEGIKIPELAPYDIEYLFIKLRAVSVGEKATVQHTCPHCNHANQVDVDLASLEVHFPPGHDKIIRVTQTLGFEMKYPDMEASADLDQNDPDSIMQAIAMSIKCVYNGNDVIDVSQEPVEDVVALIEQLPSKQFQEIQKFFETMPKLAHDAKYVCKNCKSDVTIHLEGIADFF